MKAKKKVLIYIFREKNGEKELLVFSHRDHPEAGIQVVGGTVDKGEGKKTALIRELEEESGIVLQKSDLTKIGNSIYQRKDNAQINYRTYYSFETNQLPDEWDHVVKSTGADNNLVFQFFWISITKAKTVLVGNMQEFI